MTVESIDVLGPTDCFVPRHLGPSAAEQREMLTALGCDSLDALSDQTLPPAIRLKQPLKLDPPRGEFETLVELRAIAEKNRIFRSLIGMGYYDTITPPVIQRNIFENPGWYTQYTPYQAEIAQGRLEALINFQTMVADLTGLPLANASLLDEATAGAEAMHMCHGLCKEERHEFFVADDCHPQTIAVVQTRARPLKLKITVGNPRTSELGGGRYFGVLLQYPTTDGRIEDYADVVRRVHADGALVAVATDLLALTLLKPPGEWGADIVVGSSQRFGVPLGFGGPHAAFMSTRDEFARQMPGRIIGVSKDAQGKPAFRLAIQTREQHIRREKATSNICTAQVLLAVMAGMYAVYHGPQRLKQIAQRVHAHAVILAERLRRMGHEILTPVFFDTLRVKVSGERGGAGTAERVRALSDARGINFRYYEDQTVGISVDETIDGGLLQRICACFGGDESEIDESERSAAQKPLPAAFARTSAYLTHAVFNRYHTEHEMLRYIKRLESRDLSLTSSMIPLGSCTMKLNAAAEMFPVTWPAFSRLHPYAPPEQTVGYREMFLQLEEWLAEITGFAAVSLQPNSGAQGESAGLLAIHAYHASRGESHRDVCLIPVSAHGTNPASAVMSGLRVVVVKCDERGNIDVSDLKAKAAEHADKLAALMVTYPSTHGVFEEAIKEICAVVHQYGGQVYMDGANMNAQVGLCRPADIGADVCHLNLHKTFCIPHGGGGPGMGPIGVARHLAGFLPSYPLVAAPVMAWQKESDDPASHLTSSFGNGGAVSAAPWGSASILPISWMYIRMMGGTGLRAATQTAILNANYMAQRLSQHYSLVYTGRNGRIAHEFIIDLRPFKKSANIEPDDVAKRLMDYGFHAPTMSFPVVGTLMIEPTESESKSELDRLCDALIAIRGEIRAIEEGRMDKADNPLKNAPHTAAVVTATEWARPYSREQAAWPAAWVREHKFWPFVGRIDNVWGDRNLFCTCPPLQDQLV